MSSNRRQFGKLAIAAVVVAAAFSTSAFAQEFKFRYGTAFPSDHPGAIRMKEAAETIKKESKGRIEIQVFPQSQLGSEPDMISQVRSGALQFMSTAGSNLQTMVPGWLASTAWRLRSRITTPSGPPWMANWGPMYVASCRR